jgi:hypothetical protein
VKQYKKMPSPKAMPVDVEEAFIIDDIFVTSQTVVAPPTNNWAVKWNSMVEAQKEKETMTTTATLAYDARTRLIKRLHSVYMNKRDELSEKFNLKGPKSPTTFKELKEYLAKGMIVVDGGDENENNTLFDSWRYLLRIEDPSKPRDQKGYDAAHTKLSKAYDAALDVIYVTGGEAGLKALNEFEAATFA